MKQKEKTICIHYLAQNSAPYYTDDIDGGIHLEKAGEV